MLRLGIAGVPFVGADIPGFYGNATDEIFVMFYQLGAFYPFMRGHSHIEAQHREPYLQSELVKRTIKDAVFLRYELMHYIYTLFFVASTEGLPIMRTMFLEFPHDQETFKMSDQFMFGDALLVAPKVRKAIFRQNKYFFPLSEDDADKWWSIDVYLPPWENTRGTSSAWYSYQTKLRYSS